MNVPDAMAERHARVLTELAELGLEMARELRAQVAKVEGLQDAERLALAFHRITRSVRLTLALETRLVRDRQEIAGEDRKLVQRQVVDRQHRLRTKVGRDVWTEREEEEAEALTELLEERLDDLAAVPGFLDAPLETQIAWLRAELGLPANDAAPAPDLRRNSG